MTLQLPVTGAVTKRVIWPVDISGNSAAVPTVDRLITSNTAPTITGTADLGTGGVLTVIVGIYIYENVATDSTGKWSVDTATSIPKNLTEAATNVFDDPLVVGKIFSFTLHYFEFSENINSTLPPGFKSGNTVWVSSPLPSGASYTSGIQFRLTNTNVGIKVEMLQSRYANGTRTYVFSDSNLGDRDSAVTSYPYGGGSDYQNGIGVSKFTIGGQTRPGYIGDKGDHETLPIWCSIANTVIPDLDVTATVTEANGNSVTDRTTNEITFDAPAP